MSGDSEKYVMKHKIACDKERLNIANKGFIKSHLKHTFRHRIENLLSVLID